MKKILLLLTLILSINSFSQSLSAEKVKKIKASTLQIFTDSSAGTGFFIDAKGTIATCLHVVLNAIVYNKPMYARSLDGTIIQLQLTQLTDSGIVHSLAYDLIILKPNKPLTKPVTFLKLGNFNSLNEGQDVYTCGYPFGDTTQFISKGIISTKLTKPSTASFPNGIKITELRQELLLDLTSNHGNSGGALIKLTATAEDVVVGIVDYANTPYKKDLDSIKMNIQNSSWAAMSMGVSMDSTGKTISEGYNPLTTAKMFANFFESITFGVNGAVSVNHLSQILKELKP